MRLAGVGAFHSFDATACAVQRVRNAAAKPFSWPMVGTRRGLSRLEPAAVRSPPSAMERRRGARTRSLRWKCGPSERRPATYVGRLARGLPCQTEPIHDASGRGVVRAGEAFFRGPADRVADLPILSFLYPARWLSRRHRGPRSHFDRLLQQLFKVREAARARTG